jgi:predicted RNA-binding Zn-ribbon protein involved in translation (DUF1610 family)
MRKNLVLGGIAAVLLLIAGYRLILHALQPDILPTHINPNAVCLACQKDVAVTPRLSEAPPWKCPQCGQASVYTWLYCYDCRKRLVPNLELRGGTRMPPIMPACPKCGGTRVGAYDPIDPEQKSEGDLPLPKWP